MRSLPPDINPKVMEQIADSVGMDMRTLKGSEAQPASSSPTLAVPARGKPRSARPAKVVAAASPCSRSESPEAQEIPAAQEHDLSDVAEVWWQNLSVLAT